MFYSQHSPVPNQLFDAHNYVEVQLIRMHFRYCCSRLETAEQRSKIEYFTGPDILLSMLEFLRLIDYVLYRVCQRQAIMPSLTERKVIRVLFST